VACNPHINEPVNSFAEALELVIICRQNIQKPLAAAAAKVAIVCCDEQQFPTTIALFTVTVVFSLPARGEQSGSAKGLVISPLGVMSGVHHAE
jgi:hypothetical protein